MIINHLSNVRRHSSYPPETAGRLMITNVPITLSDFTIGDARKNFLQNLSDLKSINYLYVVNKTHQLVGVLSLRDLLRLPGNQEITEIMHTKLITAHPHTDQERIAYLALKNNLKSIPIVDKDNKFLGIVPTNTILSITFQEAHENILRLAGIHQRGDPDDIIRLPAKISLIHRLPWLLVGLIGGLLAASIVSDFENTLEQNIILAAFIPLIVYIADATGTQIQAFFIRDIVLNPDLHFTRYFTKQLFITLLTGSIMGVGLVIFTGIVYHRFLIALVLGLSLFASVISSLITGLLIPYLFHRFHLDPANGSGPIGTIIQDIASITIYLTIASLIL